MKLQGRLELLQGIVYLELFCVVDLLVDDLLGIEVDGCECWLVERQRLLLPRFRSFLLVMYGSGSREMKEDIPSSKLSCALGKLS